MSALTSIGDIPELDGHHLMVVASDRWCRFGSVVFECTRRMRGRRPPRTASITSRGDREPVWVKDSMVLGHADYHFRHEGVLYGYKPGE